LNIVDLVPTAVLTLDKCNRESGVMMNVFIGTGKHGSLAHTAAVALVVG